MAIKYDLDRGRRRRAGKEQWQAEAGEESGGEQELRFEGGAAKVFQ